ncbi:MAG: sugar ABC transporter ATP-binding protein [Planctomycetaceae bacterium]|nr:sugar ABC transporter ATP-binding protein [Planctomycetaceae bacterium]
MSDTSVLEIKKVSKRFGGLRALKQVDFHLRRGEVHALVGENGAGKSTLMKIFGGVHTRDEGSVRFRGEEVHFHNPNQSMDAGIAIIYQELSTLPSMTVIENLFMGRMPTRHGILDWKRLHRESRAALALVGLERVDPRTTMDKLSIAQRQLVEIAKALTKDASVVVMDEPNSSLSPMESERLFSVIEELKQKEISIIYVSHKLDEVIRIADRITVLRDGEYVGTIDKAEASEDKLIQMMVGRQLNRDHVTRKPGTETLLEAKNISGKGFHDVSFDVRKGEILCFAGLMGAGRSETLRAIIGAPPLHSGTLLWEGRPVRFKSPTQALKNGIAMLQEDRKRQSLFMGLPIAFNMQIGALSSFKRGGIVDFNAATSMVRDYVHKLDIKLASIWHPVRSLSGGNQQKTILARWLAVHPKMLILDEPTHGVDVGAKAEIYNLIRSLADEGMAIVLISSELPEVLAMADRVVVMHEGTVEAVLSRSDGLSEESIMRYASGAARRGEAS